MNSIHRLSMLAGAALLAAACADTGAAVSAKEDMLAGAGFVMKKADTPARMASIEGAAAAPVRAAREQ